MRRIFQIVLVLISSSFYAQNSLWIEIEPRNSINADFHVYKNDSLIYKYCESKYESDNTLDNLNKGKYNILYSSLSGIQSVEVEFDTENDIKIIELFADEVDYKKLNEADSLIENLVENELLTIKYSTADCFNSNEIQTVIAKKNNRYYKIANNRQRPFNQKKIKSLIEYEKILKSSNFENALHPNDGWISTSSVSFEISQNDTILFKKSLISGNWDRISDIRKFLK